MYNFNILQESFNLIFEILKTAISVECMMIRYKTNNSNLFKIVKHEGCSKEFLEKIKCKELLIEDNKIKIKYSENKESNNKDENKNKAILDDICPCIQILNRVKDFIENSEVKKVINFTNFGSFYRNNKISFDNSPCSIFSSIAIVPIKKLFFDIENYKIKNNNSFESNKNNSENKDERNNNIYNNDFNINNYKGFFQLSDKKPNLFNKNDIEKIERISLYFSQLLNDIETILTGNIFNKFKILIVEDSYEVKIITHKLLSKLGFNTLSASNGKEALEIIKKDKIDLVITDIVMPYINGLDLIKKCYEKYEHYGPKFIIFTTYDESIKEEFVNKYNVFAVLSKPLTDIKKLKNTIEECLMI